MITGLGIDVVEIERIRDSLGRFGDTFVRRILTDGEEQEMKRLKRGRAAFLASRWAAKEAAVKALGTGFSGGIGFHDLEIDTQPSGEPRLLLHGKAAEQAEKRGTRNMMVSISHERSVAVAVVAMES